MGETGTAAKGAAIIHAHGGWFGRNGHAYGICRAVASSAGADTFIPDYRLAPEHPFPAAVTDVGHAIADSLTMGSTRSP